MVNSDGREALHRPHGRLMLHPIILLQETLHVY